MRLEEETCVRQQLSVACVQVAWARCTSSSTYLISASDTSAYQYTWGKNCDLNHAHTTRTSLSFLSNEDLQQYTNCCSIIRMIPVHSSAQVRTYLASISRLPRSTHKIIVHTHTLTSCLYVCESTEYIRHAPRLLPGRLLVPLTPYVSRASTRKHTRGIDIPP